uniref:Cilia- and flagella-associated protein 61 N-terminal domain-containing protein n=1 Tax=Timema bartmani TaxID=61472 RepID=A0A7R9I577_9NEOP|nr:unnamed protein product [Timema bartmani]
MNPPPTHSRYRRSKGDTKRHALLQPSVQEPALRPIDIFDEYFTHLLPLGGKDFSRIQTILLCVRQRYLKKMKIRHAREEDHDDLMPLFDRSACRLREHYGEFFISELISTADEKRHIMVAEVNITY